MAGVQSELLTSHTDGNLLLDGGVSKMSVQVGRNPVLLSNAGVGDLQSKGTGISLFSAETEITGFVPGENGKAEQQALWEALVLRKTEVILFIGIAFFFLK